MNRIYRLIWSALHQAWIVVGELTRAHKKKATTGAAIALGSILFSSEVLAETQNITLPGNGTNYQLQAVPDLDPTTDDRANGKDAYIITTGTGTTAANNPISIDSGVTIQGGYSISGGNGGIAIKGDRLKINNKGSITGGDGASSRLGYTSGNGASAITGNDLEIDNEGSITGGNGGYGDNSTVGAAGGNGGSAITGNNLTINNNGQIQGGEGGGGGSGGNGSNGNNGGEGASAITGNDLEINNNGHITGGYGGYGGYGNYDDESDTVASSSNGGDGGIAIKGDRLKINNNGRITGGNGDMGGSGDIDSPSDGNGGKGGNAITGNNLTINNNGQIQGGNGGDSINQKSGNGGDAIKGHDLTITNSSKIIGGTKGRSWSNDDGEMGAAINLSSGNNKLTIKNGSDIQGDVILATPTTGSQNSLLITSEAETTIGGNLKANDGSDVTLSGKQLSFQQNADFGNGSLTFTEGAKLHANTINFNDTKINTEITDWDQDDILLASVTQTITGKYQDGTNSLVTPGSKNYAGVIGRDNKVYYELKWNDHDGDGYGTFDLKKGSTLNLHVSLNDNKSDNNNQWDGKSLTKEGEGTLQFSAKNHYFGTTDINNGTLKLAVAEAIANTSAVNINQNATLNLGGNNQTISMINNRGTILINDLNAAPLTNAVTITGDMYMAKGSMLILNNCPNCAGQTYIQNGNWRGDGGIVRFGSILGGDNSITDKLQINGTATGTTKVQVNNENGAGAQTIEGIELITTNGTANDAFQQDGRIVAGSYEYHLQQGKNSGQNTNNWYLTSKVSGDSNNDGGSSNNGSSNNKEIRIFRPEAGSYASNLAAANTLFNMRLADRQGNGWYVDPVSGEQKYSSVWVRIVQGHNKNTMSEEQSKTTSNRTVFQIGGDILAGSLTQQDQLHIGLTGGYARQNSTTRNYHSGYRSDGKVEGYSAGMYATWYQNSQERYGAYIDSWILYNWFNNTVHGEQLAKEKYHSHGMSASLEAGYNQKIASYQTSADMQHDIYLRPQAQIQWSDVKANEHTERNGTRVYGKGNGNIQTRLGIRLSLDRHHQNNESTNRIEPFAEINWLHNSKDYGVNMTDANSTINGRHNMTEIKIGVEGQIKNNLRLWGNISQKFGKNNQRDTQGIAGVKYTF
ncbi:autotransporter outer membrane beta-barrel domain-containing protein [Snodgrassella communis]|uniref:autotransporter outer membrane beta-barrel domain-containing protein n=1 Tax=Snodgrassella communis TaxID=2946699 RepID=UPI00286BA7B6|nr:autotransporter outer membrane beta-barrel domain-containing protein [Snodgrassella communis]WMY91930.1 autotransporter outer membrane beta-barrel domain-containing protein [Snodgrassella communis]